MADKTYKAIFVPREVRQAIKKEAVNNNRTMIEELATTYKVKL